MPRKSGKCRLDSWLVGQGYFSNLKDAEVAIRLGRVRDVKGSAIDKPGHQVGATFHVQIEDSEGTYVSRGALKLVSLLNELGWNLKGVIALDVGASTGGFTQVLLERGVKLVYAVDVGTHQLHEKLRADPRVRALEKTDIRRLDFGWLEPSPHLVVVDVSFVSIKAVARLLKRMLPEALFIFLIKPQFEVSRYQPKKRGVVTERNRKICLEEMLQFLSTLGLQLLKVKESAIKGMKGNQETFAVAQSSIPKHIFRSYDIRGDAEKELTDFVVERIGRSFAKRLRHSAGENAKIGVGWDERLSSPRIRNSLVRGLYAENLKIIELGAVTTPMAYFSHYSFDLDALIQITASHNPKDDNGLKMMIQKNTLFGPEILSLHAEAQAETLLPLLMEIPQTTNISETLKKNYIDYLHTNIQLKRKFKLALDCGNGMAGMVAREVFAPYASRLDILFEDVDCRFPNHEADPTVLKNLEPLQRKLLESGADIGFAFDGDADRLGVITAKGRVLFGDEILMLLSEFVLRSQPGATIIGEVKCSEKLFRMIEKKGGRPLMYRTGHSLIKKKMKEVHAPIAGEMSGHLFFSDRYFGFDDAVYGALRVLEVVDQLQLDLDEWIAQYPSSFITPEIRVACEESEKEMLVEKVKKSFAGDAEAKLHLIDGVRISFRDGAWALVRASNTQAVLVLRIEAPSKARLHEIAKHLGKALGKSIHV